MLPSAGPPRHLSWETVLPQMPQKVNSSRDQLFGAEVPFISELKWPADYSSSTTIQRSWFAFLARNAGELVNIENRI